ncbi:ImmA/IrrE family metallo-endopeptidase [Lactiplantibacillus pentosus]|uniref:ImmA/IrrE family metallo-endopeptidase n=1 Tax=Lactiplantibacillus pentosus TaxID=1589 RepID=UPI001F293DA9|nr:ImmA/IrrE family metallo-endopeptidase [Lactiplantibacillus pentosus]MCE6030392.1 ImmA/IrrE family metallo-endopeptidase [Lactiplantibacillus pentosus]
MMHNSSAIALAESVAENIASTFLTNYFGSDIFIGADIERILAEQANIIYQDVADPKYSGAAVSYKGTHFIALNTHQTLRARYASAAHELWHLGLDTNLFGDSHSKALKITTTPDFDTERAADHFAAAVMMPKDAIIRTWYKYVHNYSKPNRQLAQTAIIRVANVSSMPYEAVARRLSELDLLLSTSLVRLTEDEWQAIVSASSFPPSPLDQVVPFKKFSHYSTVVNQLVDHQQLSLLEAAQLLTYADPTVAKNFLERRQALVNKLEAGI